MDVNVNTYTQMIRTIMLEEKDIQCESENPCLLQLCMWASWFCEKIRMILLKLYWWFHVYLDRLANFIVTVSDQRWPITQAQLGGPEFHRCGQYHGTPPAGATVSVTCSAGGILGRYVYILSSTIDNFMTICEAEIAGGGLKLRCCFT